MWWLEAVQSSAVLCCIATKEGVKEELIPSCLVGSKIVRNSFSWKEMNVWNWNESNLGTGLDFKSNESANMQNRSVIDVQCLVQRKEGWKDGRMGTIVLSVPVPVVWLIQCVIWVWLWNVNNPRVCFCVALGWYSKTAIFGAIAK